MDVQVSFKTLSMSGKKGLDALMPTAYNKIAQALSKEIKQKLKGIECETHKTQTRGNIVVVAGEKLKFQKSGFCCKEFEDSLVFKK